MTKYTYSDDIISDLHKDARGYRPREGFWEEWTQAPAEVKQVIWDGLLREMERACKDEELRAAQALKRFRADLKRVMDSQNVDWKTALRWLMQAEDATDIEFFLWDQGISWAKNREIQNLYNEKEAA